MVSAGDDVCGVQSGNGLLVSCSLVQAKSLCSVCIPEPKLILVGGKSTDDACVSRGATVPPLLRLCPPGTLCKL